MKERLIDKLESWGFKRHGSFYVREHNCCYVWVEIVPNGKDVVRVNVDLALKLLQGCYLNGGRVNGFLVYEYMLKDENEDILCSSFKRCIVECFTSVGWDIADGVIHKLK